MIRLLISKRRDADWVSSSWYGKNGGYVQWAKKYNVKQFAESILFLQQHAIHDKKTLDALVDGSSAKYHELMKTIKDAEEKMATNKVIKTHIINYAKTRETYITYRKSGYSKKFFEAHRDEITLHKAAKEAFPKLPFLIFPEGKEPPEFIQYLGKVLPYAVIGLLVIYCLKDVPGSGTYGIPEFLAIVFIVLLHRWKKNILLSIGGGTVFYMLLVQFVFCK